MIYKENKINSSFFAYTYCNYPPLVHNAETQNKNSSGANMYNFDPQDADECPECGFHMETNGDKWAGEKVCTNEECDHSIWWDNLP